MRKIYDFHQQQYIISMEAFKQGDAQLSQLNEALNKISYEQILQDPNYETPHDAQFKVIIIGDSGVGKSCLMQRLTQSAFKSDHQITIGVEFGSFMLKLDGKTVIKLQIWDTAGQEQFRSITKLFYKNSHAALVVYDVTKQDTFKDVSDWLNEIEDNRDQEDMMVYLVGNRIDLGEDVRQVSLHEALKMQKEKRLDNLFETSAKTGMNVVELFVQLTKHLYMNNKSKLDQFREKEAEDLGMSTIGNNQNPQYENNRGHSLMLKGGVSGLKSQSGAAAGKKKKKGGCC